MSQTLPDEVDGSTSSRNCLQPGHVSPAIQDESSLESEYLHGHTVDVPTSPKTDKHCSGLEGSPPSRKRVASQNDVWSIKNPRPGLADDPVIG